MKVIHIVRDARDVALSFARTPWWSNDLMENISRWAEEVDQIRTFGKTFSHNFVELRYEDLVTQPLVELKRTLKLFEINLESAMISPNNLIDYSSFFKGKSKNTRSKEWNEWNKNKKDIFFSENVFAWEKEHASTFLHLPRNVKKILTDYNYKT